MNQASPEVRALMAQDRKSRVTSSGFNSAEAASQFILSTASLANDLKLALHADSVLNSKDSHDLVIELYKRIREAYYNKFGEEMGGQRV